MGTANVVEAALDAGVKKVLMVSTDKAVSPANLYGATKLAAEKFTVQSNAYAGGLSNPIFVRAVRQCRRLARLDRPLISETTREAARSPSPMTA